MYAIIISAAAVAVLLLWAAIATRPESFRIERSVTIAAPAGTIFAEIEDLHRWAAWNPFEKQDPSASVTHSGPAARVGSSYHFAGKKMGEGRMTLREITPNERVVVDARFIKPFSASSTIDFTLQPVADGVSVTWAMYGRQTLMGKAMSLVVDMDRMMGKSFESGLTDMKRVAEGAAEKAWETMPLAGSRRTVRAG